MKLFCVIKNVIISLPYQWQQRIVDYPDTPSVIIIVFGKITATILSIYIKIPMEYMFIVYYCFIIWFLMFYIHYFYFIVCQEFLFVNVYGDETKYLSFLYVIIYFSNISLPRQ